MSHVEGGILVVEDDPPVGRWPDPVLDVLLASVDGIAVLRDRLPPHQAVRARRAALGGRPAAGDAEAQLTA